MSELPKIDNPEALLSALRQFSEQREQVHERLKAQVAEIAEQEHTGEALDGGVVARVNGRGVLLGVEIGTRAKRTTDNLTLGEAVAEAVRRAESNAKRAMAEQVIGTMLGQPLARLLPRERLERFFGDR